MSFFDAVASAFRKYFDFSGRASRSEFWWFFLFCILLYMLAFSLTINDIGQPDESNPEAFLSKALTSWFGIAFIVTLIPSISVSVRRFHDINMSGWWYVALQIVPSILSQFIFILVLFLLSLYLRTCILCAPRVEERTNMELTHFTTEISVNL